VALRAIPLRSIADWYWVSQIGLVLNMKLANTDIYGRRKLEICYQCFARFAGHL